MSCTAAKVHSKVSPLVYFTHSHFVSAAGCRSAIPQSQTLNPVLRLRILWWLHLLPISQSACHSPETFVAVQAHHRIVIVLQQQGAITLPLRHKRKLSYGQGAHPLPIRRHAAQLATVVVPIVLAITGTHRVLGFVPKSRERERVTHLISKFAIHPFAANH